MIVLKKPALEKRNRNRKKYVHTFKDKFKVKRKPRSMEMRELWRLKSYIVAKRKLKDLRKKIIKVLTKVNVHGIYIAETVDTHILRFLRLVDKNFLVEFFSVRLLL